MKEIITEKYIVRIHPGKRTEEERKEVLKSASEKFYRGIQSCPNHYDRICFDNRQ